MSSLGSQIDPCGIPRIWIRTTNIHEWHVTKKIVTKHVTKTKKAKIKQREYYQQLSMNKTSKGAHELRIRSNFLKHLSDEESTDCKILDLFTDYCPQTSDKSNFQ